MAVDQPAASPASSFLSPHAINRRRQSLPSRAKTAPGHGAPSHNNIQPASPEVISSLISSLSTISTPAQTHFDSFPHIGSKTAPSSPSFAQTEFSQDAKDLDKHLGQQGFGMDYGAYKPADSGAESSFLHPDDAAIAPVVRMAKAPSSPRSRTSFAGTGGGDSPLRSSSRASHTSSKLGQDESVGIGVISTEPGPRQSTASIASSSSGGRKSLKGQLSLFKRGSREFLKDKESPSRANSAGYNSMVNGSRSRASLRSTHSLHSMGDLAEEEKFRPDTSDLPEEDPRTSVSSNPNPPKPNTDTVNVSPGGIGSGRVIPTRESSLRHSYSGSSKKRRSARHSRYSSIGDSKIDEVNPDEEKVNKRIKEIKEQQKKIKDELVDEETTQTPDNRNLTPSTTKQTLPAASSNSRLSYQSSRVAEESPKANAVLTEEADDSAPSPTVMTRRNNVKKRSTGPLTPKTTNIQPSATVEETDKLSQSEQERVKRRYSIANTPSAENNRRTSANGTFSPSGRLSSAEDRPSSADSLDEAVEAYTASPRLTQKVTHPQTGRAIAFSEVGDPQGYVVFCCVGMGLTRYLTAFYDELAWTLKLRLITPDRPGVGESEPCMDGSGTPLSWPDDVAIICNALKINKFSMLAHSAGAIYALATALRMPQHMRGRLHLLAPWIPPSQMSGMGPHKEPLPSNAVPYSQRILRALPAPIFKVANSSFMSATSASITSSLPKSQRRNKRKNTGRETPVPPVSEVGTTTNGLRESALAQPSINRDSHDVVSRATANPTDAKSESAVVAAVTTAMLNEERQSDYDNRLTHMIWDLATTNANPAVDLLVCLERRQAIGFRYVDINRAVVIHHGSRDTRVPVDNVKWLGKTMRRCEVRILEGEGHGLMASAIVMSNVLTEISKEWDDWTTVVQGKREGGRRATVSQH